MFTGSNFYPGKSGCLGVFSKVKYLIQYIIFSVDQDPVNFLADRMIKVISNTQFLR